MHQDTNTFRTQAPTPATRPAARAPRRSAFTLIELLVVLSVIMLLISILLPTLSNAREAARRVNCLNNLRQVGIATYVYANDHEGMLPARNDDSNAFRWGYTLYRKNVGSDGYFPLGRLLAGYGKNEAKGMYVETPELFTCPSTADNADENWQPSTILEQINRKFEDPAFNAWFHVNYMPNVDNDVYADGDPVGEPVERSQGSLTLAASSGRIWVADGFNLYDGNAGWINNPDYAANHVGAGGVPEGVNATFFDGSGRWIPNGNTTLGPLIEAGESNFEHGAQLWEYDRETPLP